MEVYAVLVDYTNFEDWQNNYAELRGVYTSKEKALEYIYSAFLEEIEMEMDCYSFSYDENNTEQYLKDNINSALDQWGYIELRQHFGNGVADIRLEKRKVIEDDNKRTCSICGKPIKQGYYNESEFTYYCSDECLNKHYTKEEYNELYNNNEMYWTSWED